MYAYTRKLVSTTINPPTSDRLVATDVDDPHRSVARKVGHSHKSPSCLNGFNSPSEAM